MLTAKSAALGTAFLAASALALTTNVGTAGATPSPSRTPLSAAAPSADDPDTVDDSLTQPWQDKYQDRRDVGVEQRLRSGSDQQVQRLGRGAFADTAATGSDKIFVVLAEFGDTRHSTYPDGASDATTFDGPAHNEIPRPDRSVDNSTLWQKDYDRGHYRDMYFDRMKGFYEKQSLGTYSIDGTVSDWVSVPFNEARYGRDLCGSVICNNTWSLVKDALAYWTQGKLDQGWSMERIQEYLRTYDQQDRYDFDEDGDFAEPDGYIDHFQIVHAGGDQADGDPVYGEDAIWSHRWYAQIQPYGTSGPTDGGQFGGVNIGQGGVVDPDGGNVSVPNNPTGVWVGDYTIQPENGGLSVFAHEFAHDLGLPDLYDTSGNTGGASNSVEHWSLMAQSRGTLPGDAGIGDRPQPFGAWDKFQLGWLDYELVRSGKKATVDLLPGQSTKGTDPNAALVLLPDKEVETDLGDPCDGCGERYYFSGSGDELDNTMTAEVPDAGGTELTAQVRYDIEPGWDYAFLQASDDGGDTWADVETSESYTGADESGFNASGFGISGTSDDWVDLTADVPAGTDALRWRYRTDTATTFPGFQVDQVALDGEVVGDAEEDSESDVTWDLDGFITTDGVETDEFLNAYFVDNRQYRGLDKVLSHVYNFGYTGAKAQKVDFFRFAPGALISYWDSSVADNNVGDHPGSGLVLPVDARPDFTHYPDGTLARTKVQTFDSTFSLERSRGATLHYQGEAYRVQGRPGVPLFDDTQDYWFDSDEHGTGTHPGAVQPGWLSVDVPDTGTTVRVVRVARDGTMTIKVGTSR